MNKKKDNDFSQKLKDKLRELFQFDSSDLDFGIYRIMNYKRKEIEDFIENDLIREVEKEFKKYKIKSYKELIEKVEEKERKIKEDFGDNIFTNGELKEKYGETKLIGEYFELKKQTEDTEITESIRGQTFNDLYNFFSRYYEDGDFISKRRYSSKHHKYAIPYNGEEVKLYWANFDQYYIKTGEVFKDYVFTQKGWKFIFKTTLAEVEAGNVKGERRYFFLSPNEAIDIKDSTCIIKFDYRPLIEQDFTEYPIKTKAGALKKTGITQGDLNAILKDKIINSINLPKPKKILLEKQEGKTILEKHLYKFTRKITSDFFIHKDLKGFLERELDYFIKTEVLDIDSLDTEKERYFNRHITRAKVVKNIGKKIIDFLSQIEDFQKMLWEKKKFVLRTDYVITIDRIPEEFYAEIMNNKIQLEEWEELGLGEINKKEDLVTKKDLFGNKYKKLPIDTKYFNQDFKERLLEKLTVKENLDDLIDGVLIKSENWQALDLLLEKYKEKVKCIYIDPPYNTGNDEFLYKDKYLHSSWLSMMEERLRLSKNILKNDGVIFVSISNNANYYNESYKLGIILETIFDKRFADLIWKRRGGTGSYTISDITEIHEYIYSWGNSKSEIFKNIINLKKVADYKYKDQKGKFKWHDLVIHQYTKGQRPNLFYGVVYNFKKKVLDFYKDERNFNVNEEIVIYPSANGNSVYTMTKKSMQEVYERGDISVLQEGKEYKINIKKYLFNNRDIIDGDVLKSILNENALDYKIGGTSAATKELKNLFSSKVYDTPKPIDLIKLLIYISTLKKDRNNFICDFFAGSGTTAHSVMKLNKEDNGRRKYILIEMADYFNTIIIPRLKKICYSFNWKDGKPQDDDGISQIIKYHCLEQYEDTLHNLEFPQEEKGQRILSLLSEEEKSEYLMKYMLKFETEGSPSLLALKQFSNPFEYKLKIISGDKAEEIVSVDLVETFNYLIGLKINKYRYLTDNGRKYVFVLGERNYKKVAVVWRSTVDIDLEKDKEVISKIINDFKPEEIYINGDSLVKNYKPIESEFKSRAGV